MKTRIRDSIVETCHGCLWVLDVDSGYLVNANRDFLSSLGVSVTILNIEKMLHTTQQACPSFSLTEGDNSLGSLIFWEVAISVSRKFKFKMNVCCFRLYPEWYLIN